jgi:hypothetical protein
MSLNDQTGELLDRAALALQALRGAVRPGLDVLVRIDNSQEGEAAPYQFDAATGRLHRRGCRAIPEGAPLYARWHLSRADLNVACPRCRPVPDETKPETPTERNDLLLGVVSLVSQFSNVLKDRGKDYQNTEEGRALTDQLTATYSELGRREKEVVDAMLGALDAIIERVRSLDQALKQTGADGKE